MLEKWLRKYRYCLLIKMIGTKKKILVEVLKSYLFYCFIKDQRQWFFKRTGNKGWLISTRLIFRKHFLDFI